MEITAERRRELLALQGIVEEPLLPGVLKLRKPRRRHQSMQELRKRDERRAQRLLLRKMRDEQRRRYKEIRRKGYVLVEHPPLSFSFEGRLVYITKWQKRPESFKHRNRSILPQRFPRRAKCTL